MHIQNYKKFVSTAGLIASIFFVISTPGSVFASTSKPTCTITTHTSIGTTTIRGTGEVLLQKGSKIGVVWESTRATKASDRNGKTISVAGSATSTPKKNTVYAYTFSNENKKVTCKVSVTIVTGAISTPAQINTSSKFSITGKASGVEKVQIQIFKKGSTTPRYVSGTLSVKRGVWKTKIMEKLPNGTYTVNLLGIKNRVLNTFASSTLLIGKRIVQKDTSSSTLIVQIVPLLIGGTARAGAIVPVSYLQVINIGKNPATIRGFKIELVGTALPESITGLTIVDDSETLGGSTGNVEGQTPFVDALALIPIDAAFAPGEMRLFTIKAIVTNTIMPYLGTQFKINVIGVDSNARMQNTFPIRGVSWTLGL